MSKLARQLVPMQMIILALASTLTLAFSPHVRADEWTFHYFNDPIRGNWTFTQKPVSPMPINASQIKIGANWTYVYTLLANRSYHIYCYGDWIDSGPAPQTDYDIYVYNPLGELEGYHTEPAGLPEHLGTTVDEPLFTPKYSGNYSFVIRNDPRESQAAEPATLMVVEHIELNVWHSLHIEGNEVNATSLNTSWAFEFVSSSERVEVEVEVPDSLDMYEARLYLMANPNSKMGISLSGLPLAWEPGLYGEVSGSFGGYNLDSRGFRGHAYASCEFFGQDMFINYSSSYGGESLYHLVFIGELGSGDIQFRIKAQPYSNYTFTQRPVLPMKIEENQVQVGSNWTYVYTLVANRTYHIYFYGDWVSKGSTHTTDYDIYVYNPLGELEGYHTEAAGLPEHLGTTVDEPLFTPKYSGNYSFVIRNDPRESQAAEPATFMAIDSIEPNIWHSRSIEGKQDSEPVENTSWAFEFASSSERVEVEVEVPDSLDMYEARLYLMANPASGKGEMFNERPLAWEPGLYGEVSGSFGGYNLDSRGFRGHAYASCEFFGQDMFINYSSSYGGESLYHLVFIGELGSGNISFRVKTNFETSPLKLGIPLGEVYPYIETTVNVVSENSSIKEAFLKYTIDNWQSYTTLELLVYDNLCNGTIPGHEAGVTVEYSVEAKDFIDNVMRLNSSYTVKYPSYTDLTLAPAEVPMGQNISIAGQVIPASDSNNATVKVIFTSPNGSVIEQHALVQDDGNFSTSFRPTIMGSWSVQARFSGDSLRHASLSNVTHIVVQEPSFMAKYSVFIYAGFGVAIVALVIIMIRRRE